MCANVGRRLAAVVPVRNGLRPAPRARRRCRDPRRGSRGAGLSRSRPRCLVQACLRPLGRANRGVRGPGRDRRERRPARRFEPTGDRARPPAVPRRLQPSHLLGRRLADRRRRRCLRRPERRVRPGDLRQQYDLPDCTTGNGCFTKVNQSGGTSYPATNSSWISRSRSTSRRALDLRDLQGLLVEANSASIASLGAAENEAAALGAVAISNSWGSSESSSETSWDSAFFDHPGVAITASSGDGGYGVEWPAASPDVTAVGGTTLTVGPGNSYGSESAWADGGSGCSAVETKPAWQAVSAAARCARSSMSPPTPIRIPVRPSTTRSPTKASPAGTRSEGRASPRP